MKDIINLIGLSKTEKIILDFIEQSGEAEYLYSEEYDVDEYEYIEFKKAGFCLYFESNKLNSIFFYSLYNEDGYVEYRGTLPKNIDFSQSKAEVIELLGRPHEEGRGSGNKNWIKYVSDKYFIHLSFTKDSNRIQVITIETPANIEKYQKRGQIYLTVLN